MSEKKDFTVSDKVDTSKTIEEYLLLLNEEKNKLQKEFILMLPRAHLRKFKEYKKALKRLESVKAFASFDSRS